MNKKTIISAVAIGYIFLIFMLKENDHTNTKVENALPLSPHLSSIKYAVPPTSRVSGFEYYGWFLVDYTTPTPELQHVGTYTNTAFATSPLQTKIVKEVGFKRIVYSTTFTDAAVLDQMEKEMATPIPELYGVKLYATTIPDYRQKYFEIYRTKLAELKRLLEETGLLDAIDLFYLADEPAINRNIYPNQAFLDQIVIEFKKVFVDKMTMMTFAQYPEPRDPRAVWAGPHFEVPSALDVVAVNPYIDAKKVDCNTENVRSWLYKRNPYSNIDWARQFAKPIIAIGDARIINGKIPNFCYAKNTFDILKSDKNVKGLIWYQYDKSYKETHEVGTISGAANDPEFVHMIENLGKQ